MQNFNETVQNSSDPCARPGEQGWTPLSNEQIAPAACLIAFGFIFCLSHIFVSFAQLKLSFKSPTFIVLYSMSIAEIGVIVTTAMILGFQTLLRTNIFPYNISWWSSAILNLFWMSMSYHYPLIAYTRFASVYYLIEVSDILSPKKCLFFALATWTVSLFTDVVYHINPDQSQPVFYDYHIGGLHPWSTWNCHTSFWTIYNGICTALSFVFYFAAVAVVVVRRITRPTTDVVIISVQPAHSHQIATVVSTVTSCKCHCSFQLRVEYRLLIACFLSALMFQIAGLTGTYVRINNEWGGFFTPFLDACNSTVDPILLICFSTELRETVVKQFMMLRKFLLHKA